MKEFRFAVKNTIPIFFTYLFIGIAFGILMSDAGYSILQIPGRESHVHGVLEPPSRSFRATFTE